jgi:H+/Cl- antiporter ClcA
MLVALVIAIFAYPFPLLRVRTQVSRSNVQKINFCVQNDLQGVLEYLLDKQSVTDWGGLFGILVGKLLFTLFSLGFTSIPAGVYAPVFTMGAVFGRLMGEIVVYLLPSLNLQPASVSIIGKIHRGN